MTVVQLLGRLIAYDTTSGTSNRDAAMFAADYLEQAGCRIDLFERQDGNKVNVLVSTGPTDGKGVLLCGHLDVVPAVERDWQSDPFDLVETDSSYVGRGTADMKSFVALGMQALAGAAAKSLQHAACLLLTYDEELGTIGAQDFAATWDDRYPLPASAVIGEPTELRVVRAHKGHVKLQLNLRGVGGHSGYPQEGSNAIEKAAEVIVAISKVGDKWRKERLPESEIFSQHPYPTASVTTIHGGAAANIIPESCTLEVSVRTLPGQEPRAIVQQLQSAMDRLKTVGEDDVALEVTSSSPAMWTGVDAAIHRQLCELVGQRQSYGVAYTTDAGTLSGMGMDCVLFGPGSIQQAHRANEFVPKEHLIQAEHVLTQLINRCCARG